MDHLMDNFMDNFMDNHQQRHSLERAFWRQQQRPLGPCCQWPQESEPLERWSGPLPTLPAAEIGYVPV
jgi:hypothetical protein